MIEIEPLAALALERVRKNERKRDVFQRIHAKYADRLIDVADHFGAAVKRRVRQLHYACYQRRIGLDNRRKLFEGVVFAFDEIDNPHGDRRRGWQAYVVLK